MLDKSSVIHVTEHERHTVLFKHFEPFLMKPVHLNAVLKSDTILSNTLLDGCVLNTFITVVHL